MLLPAVTRHYRGRQARRDALRAGGGPSRELVGPGQLVRRSRLRLADCEAWAAGLAAAIAHACVLGMSRAAVGLIGPVFVEPASSASAIDPALPVVGVPPWRPTGTVCQSAARH
jgi:hypothetical protein